jgi:dTMP kinase
MQREAAETGKFITFEGGEGSGKSTQAGILANRLARAGRKVFATREPGGSPAAEEIREALLAGRVWQFGPFAEAVMFSVARADHIENAISQALLEGKWVVCDRFLDSTRAYQGATAGVPRGLINALERLTVGGLLPDITFILDIPPEQGLARGSGAAEARLTVSRARSSCCTSACAERFSISPKRNRSAAWSSTRASPKPWWRRTCGRWSCSV